MYHVILFVGGFKFASHNYYDTHTHTHKGEIMLLRPSTHFLFELHKRKKNNHVLQTLLAQASPHALQASIQPLFTSSGESVSQNFPLDAVTSLIPHKVNGGCERASLAPEFVFVPRIPKRVSDPAPLPSQLRGNDWTEESLQGRGWREGSNTWV